MTSMGIFPAFRTAAFGGRDVEDAIPYTPFWRFSMLCTVIDIRGDYAYIKYLDTGVVSEVAIALLPFGIDVGDKLKFENYEFERV